MTLGCYCGDDAFGPYDHSHYDITHCFQSLTILLPPSLFMLAAFLLRMARIRHLPSSTLLLDPLPRFPQIISAFMALLSVFYLIFFVLLHELTPYRIIYPSLSFIAWTLSIVLLRFEHSRALPPSPYNRIFYLLSFIASAKQAESSVMNFVFGTPVMPFDILVFLHVFLATFMLRYAVTGITDSSHLHVDWERTADLDHPLADSVEEEASTPAMADRSMWKRFLNFSANGDGAAGEDGVINADQSSLNSQYGGGGVMSSLDVKEERNPFASNPFEDSAKERGEAGEGGGGEATNPFATEPEPAPRAAPAPAAAAATTTRDGSMASKLKNLTAALREAHLLAGASMSLPSYQDAVVGGRTLIQFQLHITLAQPSVISGDPDVDTVTAWKRYREFEGLHSALLNAGRKYGLVPPELPPAPKKKALEAARERLEVYLTEVMEQPLYWDDVVEFAGVKERVEYIAGYIQQVKAQKEQEKRAKEEAVLAAVHAAEARKREREGRNQPGPAHANGTVSVMKVTVDRPAGLDYKHQIIAVSVSGWSRWLGDDSADAVGRGEGEEVEEESKARGRKKPARSTLTTPLPTSAPARRKVGSANSSLSSTAFYLTLDFPIKTSVGDYTVYHTLPEISDFRAALVRHFQATHPSLVPSIPGLVMGKTEAMERDEGEMLSTASAVEVFFQSLISTNAFQCNLLYAFLERRRPKEKGGDALPVHHISGQKPLAMFSIAAGEWKTLSSASNSAAATTTSSQATSPEPSLPSARAVRGVVETGTKRRGRGASGVAERKQEAALNAPLFPEAAAAFSPSTSSAFPPASASPHEPSALSTSLTAASPLSGASQSSSSGDSSAASTSHRFSASIPSYSLSNPSDPKSHILYTLSVREYFSLTSFIEWQLTRRYRDFESMHHTLHRLFAGYPFPPLPPKNRKVGKRKDAELEQRRLALELYIQQVINVRMFQVDDFFSFFDMNNANRQFTVGTQIKGPGEGAGGLEGVREGKRGEGEEGGEEGEGEEGDMGGQIAVRKGGRRVGNGNGATAERRPAVDQGRRGRAERVQPQAAPQPTNPFDM